MTRISSKMQVCQTSDPEGIALFLADGFLHGLDWAHNPVQPCYCCAFAHHHRGFCGCVWLPWSVAVLKRLGCRVSCCAASKRLHKVQHAMPELY